MTHFHQQLKTYLMMHIFLLQTENLRNIDLLYYFFWGKMLYAKHKKALITFIISIFSSIRYFDKISKVHLFSLSAKLLLLV